MAQKRTRKTKDKTAAKQRNIRRTGNTNEPLRCQQCGAPVSVTWHVPGSCKNCGAPFEPHPRLLVSVAFVCGVVAAVVVIILLRMVLNIPAVLFFASAVAAVAVFTLVEVLMFHFGALRLANVNDDTQSPVTLSTTNPEMLQQAEIIARSKSYAGSNKQVRAAQREQLREAVVLAKSIVGEEDEELPSNTSRKSTNATVPGSTKATGRLPRCRFRRVSATNEAGIRNMSALATHIVREHFDPIIGVEQNDYMIERFQTPEAIAAQIEDRYEYYFVLPPADDSQSTDQQRPARPVGFLAVQPRESGELYLGKFYLLKQERGKGYARTMTRFVVQRARKLGCDHILLRVNRDNFQAILAYEHLGFERTGELTTDIGGGFVMDDFVYELQV